MPVTTWLACRWLWTTVFNNLNFHGGKTIKRVSKLLTRFAIWIVFVQKILTTAHAGTPFALDKNYFYRLFIFNRAIANFHATIYNNDASTNSTN